MIDDVIVVVYDNITCVKVDVIDATQDRVCKSVDVDQKDDEIPQVEVDDVEILENVNVEVDKLEKVKHTQVGVMHVVESLSQVRVDDNFSDDDGEQVFHNGIERCTQNAAIINIDENFDKEVINTENDKVQVNLNIIKNRYQQRK